VLAHPLLDELAALLQLAVGELVRRSASTPKLGLHPVEVELEAVMVDAELAARRSPWRSAKMHRDGGDLGEQVEVGARRAIAPSRNTMFLM
jgi:hypothetical protein